MSSSIIELFYELGIFAIEPSVANSQILSDLFIYIVLILIHDLYDLYVTYMTYT